MNYNGTYLCVSRVTKWYNYMTVLDNLYPTPTFPPKKKITPGPKAFVHWSLTFLQHGFVAACLGAKAKCYRSWLKHPFNVEIVDIPIQIAALYFCCSSRVWCFWYLYWVILWQWWIEKKTTRLILTPVSFHEVVDEDTEMFWMFLRVSHIANCLRSMFHRIWHIYKS